MQYRCDQLRRCNVLKDSRAEMNHGLRGARGTRRIVDLRRFPIRPLHTDSRTKINAIRHVVVVKAQRRLECEIARGRCQEPIAVHTNAVLNLHSGYRTPVVSDGHAAGELTARLHRRTERAQKARGRSLLQRSERVVRE